MHLGLDFDNTIISYDQLFWGVAVERGLISSETKPNKDSVRDSMRADGREEQWTELQGEVYGSLISRAHSFPGVKQFVFDCIARGDSVSIVSHKTKVPYRGHPYDLHGAARNWLREQGIVGGSGISPADVYFEISKGEKLQRIGAIGCDYYVDDLPEILLDPAFPAGVKRILIDYNGAVKELPGVTVCTSWEEVQLLLGRGGFDA